MAAQHRLLERARGFVEPGSTGLRAIYLVETRYEMEAREIEKLFGELEKQAQVRQLCDGRLVSYVVQAGRSDAALLEEIEEALKSSYSFVVTQGSFDEVIYRVVRELCEDTGSTMIPAPECDVCGKPEPFPTTVNALDERGRLVSSRSCCAGCATKALDMAQSVKRSPKRIRLKAGPLAQVR